MGKRIIVTGGSGKVGYHLIEYLLSQGHEVLNLDMVPLRVPLNEKVHTMRVDLTDTGQVFGALTSHFHLTQPYREPLGQLPDAVIHMAGYARNQLVPDAETYRGNVLGAFNIMDTACKLGIKKLVIASTVCVYGVTYAEGDIDFVSFPIDEQVEVNPMDIYAISKVCIERTAMGLSRKFGTDIYCLRIGPVTAPEDYKEMFTSYRTSPEKWNVHGWSYIDVTDLARMCELAVQKDGLGFQIFNATNDEITTDASIHGSTTEFLKSLYPHVPFTRIMGEREAPMSNAKIKELLDFREENTWRKYYTPSLPSSSSSR